MALELSEWTDRVFGQTGPSGYTGTCGRDEGTLCRLTGVFENPVELLLPYSDAAVSRALWDLSVEALPVIYDRAIDWALRLRLIRSFETLFRECFAVRCTRSLSHRSEAGSALNSVCYMWWDFDCWTAAPEPLARNPIDAAFLEAMRSILAIDHIACQESALHGLGHWHHAHGVAVEEAIDRFLAEQKQLPEDLRQYALAARCGCVQ